MAAVKLFALTLVIFSALEVVLFAIRPTVGLSLSDMRIESVLLGTYWLGLGLASSHKTSSSFCHGST